MPILNDTASQSPLVDSSFITKIHFKKSKISIHVNSIGSKVSFLGRNMACKISFFDDQISSTLKTKFSLSMEVAQVEGAFDNLCHSLFPMSINSPLYTHNQI